MAYKIKCGEHWHYMEDDVMTFEEAKSKGFEVIQFKGTEKK